MANDTLIGLAIQELPAILSSLKGLFTRQNPTAPEPTDEEAIAGLQSACASSLAKDDQWLAAHPPV